MCSCDKASCNNILLRRKDIKVNRWCPWLPYNIISKVNYIVISHIVISFGDSIVVYMSVTFLDRIVFRPEHQGGRIVGTDIRWNIVLGISSTEQHPFCQGQLEESASFLTSQTYHPDVLPGWALNKKIILDSGPGGEKGQVSCVCSSWWWENFSCHFFIWNVESLPIYGPSGCSYILAHNNPHQNIQHFSQN